MKAVVIGYGISGRGAEKLLLQKGYDVAIYDDASSTVESFDFSGISLGVLSPGVPLDHPFVKACQNRAIDIVGEAAFALTNCTQKCIGITGTNGKTTAVKMVCHILDYFGIKCVALGNIGSGLSDYFCASNRDEICVVELSSFQLETLEGKLFDSAAILNISPDHLDRYSGMEEYAKAKLRLEKCMKQGGVFTVSESVYKTYSNLFVSKPALIDYSNIGRGMENQVFAAAVVAPFGISREEAFEALKTYQKEPHRIEFVREIDGIYFINDSKATNADAVVFAVDSIDRPIILIVGGVDKGGGYCDWKKVFPGKVKKLITYGEAAQLIENEIKGGSAITRASGLHDAVVQAWKGAQSGDVILLSPGCASYDMFEGYQHRGDAFKKIVLEL